MIRQYLYKSIIAFLCLTLIIPTIGTTSTYAAEGPIYNYDIYSVKNGACSEGTDQFVRRYEAATTTTVFDQYTFSGCSYQMVGDISDLYKTGYNRTSSGEGMKVFRKDGGFVDEYVRPTAYKKEKGVKIMSTRAVDGTYPNDGLHTDGYWYVKMAPVNTAPDFKMSSTGDKLLYNDGGSFTMTGTVQDAEADVITIEAQIGGVWKTYYAYDTGTPETWTLTWTGKELPVGDYANPKVTADDGNDIVELTYSGKLTVKPQIYYYWNKFKVETPPAYGWSGSGETTGYPNVPGFFSTFTTNEGARTSTTSGAYFYNLSSSNTVGYTQWDSNVARFTRTGDNSYKEDHLYWLSTTPKPTKGALVQANIKAAQNTYPDDGVHTDRYWYTKLGLVPNNNPVLAITQSNSYQMDSREGYDTYTMQGQAYDIDGDTITVSAEIGGVKKQTVLSNASAATQWYLVWRTSEFKEGGAWTNPVVTVDDNRGGTVSSTYWGTITVDKTPFYYWDKYSVKSQVTGYSESIGATYKTNPDNIYGYRKYSFDTKTGIFSGVGQYEIAPTYPTWAGTRLYNVGSFGMTENVVTNGNGVESTSYTAVPNNTVKVKDTLKQSNIFARDKTYPDDGLHSDGFWYIKKPTNNMYPVISVLNSDITVGKDNSTVELSGSIYDVDGDAITIKATIGGVLKQVIIPNTRKAQPWVLTWTDLPEGIYRNIEINASDGKGGVDTVIYRGTIIVDKTGPKKPGITITPSKEWANEAVTVSIIPGVDEKSGTEKTQYKIDNGDWEDYTNPIVLEEEGVYVITAVSIDKVGNIGEEFQQIMRIDKTLPGRPEVVLTSELWTNQDIQMIITDGSDADSGADYSEYTQDGKTWDKYTAPVDITETGEWTYQARTVDKAGNVGDPTQVIAKIDKVAPTAPKLDLSSNTYTQDPVTITLTDGKDDLSGVQRTEVKVGTGNWKTYHDEIVVDEEGETEVWARTIDVAGNISTEATAKVLIDRTAPTEPSYTLSESAWTNKDVTFNLNGSQDASEVYYEYKIGDGPYTKGDKVTITDSGEHTITARAVDAVGLVSNEIQFTVRVDKELPEAKLTPNGLDYSAAGTDVKITATDSLSGVSEPIYYEISTTTTPNGSWTVLPETGEVKVDKEGNWYVHTRVTDKAGNESIQTSNLYHIQAVPDEPNLTTTVLSDSEVRIQWTLPVLGTQNTDGYRYTIKNLTTGNESTLDYPTSSFNDTNLEAGTLYQYQLTVKNHTGSVVANTEALTYPGRPQVIIKPVYRNPSEMSVLIDPVRSAEDYRLVLMDEQGQIMQNETITSEHHMLTGLNPGIRYTLQVSARNSTGVGEASSTGLLTLPATPTGFTAIEIKEDSVNAEWQSVTTATYYDLYRNNELLYNGGDLSYKDTGLTAGTEYEYVVGAGNETGEGDVSDPLSLVTLPAQDSSLQLLSFNTSGFTAKWNGVQSANMYSLQVYDTGQNLVADYQGPNLEYAVTGLEPGSEYRISLVAFNRTGAGQEKVLRTVTLPSKVESVNVNNIGETEAEFSISSVTGATYYKIELNGEEFLTNDLNYVLSPLQGSTEYSGTVQAGNSSGWSEPTPFNFLTKPVRPISLEVKSVGETGMTLGWEKDNTAARYWITDEQGNKVDVTGTEFDISGLQPGTEYRFKVATENATGIGSESEIVWSTRTEAPDVERVDVHNTEATLNWTEPHGAVQYQVKDEATGKVYYSGSQAAAHLTELQAGKVYDLSLYAFNKMDDASKGAPIKLVTRAELNKDNAKIVDVKSHSVTIEIEKAGQEISEYIILRNGEKIAQVSAGSQVSFTDTEVDPGKAYEYEIMPVNESGEGKGVQLTTLTATNPVAAPEVKSGDDWVEITFPVVEKASEYVVTDKNGTELWRGDTLPIRLDGLEPGRENVLNIVAENEAGYPSEPVSVRVWTLPTAPMGIQSSATERSVTISFSNVNTEGLTELVIYKAGKEVGRVKAGEKSWTDNNLSPNTNHVYEVKAVNPGGESTKGTKVEQTTKPEQVVNPGSPSAPSPTPNNDKGTDEQKTDTPVDQEKDATDTEVSTEVSKPASGVFKDVSDSSFAKKEIESLAKDGVIKGFSINVFAPDKQITRMEYAALIVRILNASPDESITMTFQDVKDAAWYSTELNAAIANGIAKGFSSSEFRPNAVVNREQAAKMLVNVLVKEGMTPPTAAHQFSDDSDIAVWAAEDVKMAASTQFVQGYPDNTFRPKNGLTRAEAAVMIYRLREHLNSITE
jgi:hypothetical protein